MMGEATEHGDRPIPDKEIEQPEEVFQFIRF